MTLDQILTVEAIVKKGSFKAASEYLHKSQPSISMAIKKLEETYNIVLFSRDEYRPTLTSDGKIFYEKALNLIREFRELETLANLIGKGFEPEIRVSIDAVSPVSLVLQILRDFFKKHPNTKLRIQHEVLSGTVERLIDREVDFAITPKPIIDMDFEFKYLTKTRLVNVISPEIVKNNKITDNFLKSHSQVVLTDSARKIQKVTTGILDETKTLTVSDIGFKKEIIIQGLGWGSLPENLVKAEIKNKKLQSAETNTIKDRDIEIFLVKMKNSKLGPVAKELWESF